MYARGVVVLAVIAASSRGADAESAHYEQIRVDAGMTVASVAISGRNGAGFASEIKAMVHDHVAVGGRVEVAVMFGGVIGEDELPLDIAMAACGLVDVEVYGGTGVVRPFIGFGVGAYTIGSQTIESGPNTSGISSRTGRYLGMAPQAGVDLGRVRLAATYHAILGADLEVRQMVGTVEQRSTVSQNWLSLELSFRFGGGRRPEPR